MKSSITEMVRQALDGIDVGLRDECVEIPRRPIYALVKLCDKFPQLKGMPMLPVENPRTELEAIPHVVDAWYTGRYGDRLKLDMAVGYYPIVIRSEPWRARLPLCYGEISIRWEDLSIPSAPNVINIPTKIEGLTPQLADSLSQQEVTEIGSEYVWALNAITSLSSRSVQGLLKAGFADYNAGLENLFSKNPHNGQCKWSALQFAEKAIKQRMTDHGVKFKQIHDLQKLANCLLPFDVKLDPHLISDVQCQASARYGEVQVTRLQAVKAIQSALNLYGVLYPPNSFKFADTV